MTVARSTGEVIAFYPAIASSLLVLCMFAADRVGMVELIASGSRAGRSLPADPCRAALHGGYRSAAPGEIEKV